MKTNDETRCPCTFEIKTTGRKNSSVVAKMTLGNNEIDSENISEKYGIISQPENDVKIIEEQLDVSAEDNMENNYLKNNLKSLELMTEDLYPDDVDSEEGESSLFVGKFKNIFITKKKPVKNNCEKSPDEKADELLKKRKFPKKIIKKKHAISVVDTLISIIVIGPLIIGHWRGTWNLMDYYNFLPNGCVCFLVGTSLHWMFAIFRDVLHKKFVEKWKFDSSCGRFFSGTLRLIYTYVFCFVCNMQWRGGWIFIDSILGNDTWIVGSVMCANTGILLLLRSCRNLIAAPFIIVIDIPHLTFQFPTRYKVNTRHWALYVLDCAFSVGIIGALVVFVWRGVFVLLDLHLFPNNREHSAITSVIIGYVIVAITFCLQPAMRYTCGRMQGLSRLLVADAFLLLSFSGTVNVWRGIWAILDLWLLPDNMEMSCWITHVGCFIFLGLLNCSNSVLVRGVYIDAEEEEGRCVVFPCHYLRLFFKIEREKKEARRRTLATITRNFGHNNDGHGKEIENGSLINRPNLPTIIPANSENIV